MGVEAKSAEPGARGSDLRSVRQPLLFLALLYLVFVIYGSLVPLHFHAQPWDQAVARFRAIPYLNLGIGSRADWVANILLFMPLAFLWLGLLWSRGLLVRSLATLIVVAACVFLSIGIQFTQIFFPPPGGFLSKHFVMPLAGLAVGALWWLGDGILNFGWRA